MRHNHYADNHQNKEVWLQYVGWHPAKYGSDLKVGDKMVFNGGSYSTIIEIKESKSGKTLQVTTECEYGMFTRRRSSTTLYATKDAIK